MRGLIPDAQELRATNPQPPTGQYIPSESALRSKLSEIASIKLYWAFYSGYFRLPTHKSALVESPTVIRVMPGSPGIWSEVARQYVLKEPLFNLEAGV